MPHVIWYLAIRKQTRCPVSNEKADLCERIPGNKCSTGESAGKISSLSRRCQCQCAIECARLRQPIESHRVSVGASC